MHKCAHAQMCVLTCVRRGEVKETRFTTTKIPMDNSGDGWDLGCNAPTKGMLPPSAKRRAALGLLDII